MSLNQPDAAERLRQRLQADLRVALKARNALEVADLRHLIAALDNAGAAPLPAPSESGPTEVERRRLDDDDAKAILRREHENSRNAAAELARLGRTGEAKRAEASLAVIDRYLRSS